MRGSLTNYPNEERTFTESEVKELLTGLLKELEAKKKEGATKEFSITNSVNLIIENVVAVSDIRTLFNKLLQ